MSDLSNPGAPSRAVAADHPITGQSAVLVAPSTSDQYHNTLRLGLKVIACWRLEDIRFEFDSSFLLLDAAEELQRLARLCKQHPGAPLSIFGHADPVNDHEYNKPLSGRRAEAIYALLIRDAERWENLYSNRFRGDDWGLKAIQRMLTALGHTPGPIDGEMGPRTRESVRAFQGDQGLAVDGDPGPATRARLFLAYMDLVSKDDTGRPFRLQTTDFAGGGADARGKADFQGCSEFNPVLLFSQAEDEEFRAPAKRAERNAANAPNRRVVAFLLRPGTRVDPARWPCPTTSEGIAACNARLFSDRSDRLALGSARRHYSATQDTFACRFYHGLARLSPCEAGLAATERGIYHLELSDDVKLPSDAVLIVEGLSTTLRLSVRDCFEPELGVYSFALEQTVPGVRCTARIETSQRSFSLFESVDLHACVKRALESVSEPPLLMEWPHELIEHLLEAEEEPDPPLPEGEDWNWDYYNREPLTSDDAELPTPSDAVAEFDPDLVN